MAVSLARILAIDDEPSVIDMLSECLTENGYAIVSAQTGGDGLMLLELEHPDLVLLDLRLPGIGGLEVLRRIRMVRPDLPVIIISGLGDADAARQSLRRGAVDYLPKPFDLDHVLRAVAAALGRDWSDNWRSGAQANTA